MRLYQPTPGFPRDCHWCGIRLRDPKEDTHRRSKRSATRDHVLPKSLGGRKTVWSCRHCNQIKGDLRPVEWQLVRTAFPDFRSLFRTHAEVERAIAMMRWSHRRPTKPPARFPAGLVPFPPMCRGLV